MGNCKSAPDGAYSNAHVKKHAKMSLNPSAPPPAQQSKPPAATTTTTTKSRATTPASKGASSSSPTAAKEKTKKPKKEQAKPKKKPSPKKAAKPSPPKPANGRGGGDMNPYAGADPNKWVTQEIQFSGSSSHVSLGKVEEVKGKDIGAGVKMFKANPDKYVAMTYQTSMKDWASNQHAYTLVHRKGTEGYKANGASPSGWMTLLLHDYQQLPPFKDNVLPQQYRDKYTDAMTCDRIKLHSAKNKPILPGRGMGVGDTPQLKIIGDVDPSDIAQGAVGDCWLLSGISSLAEFDGAVKRLFRKTKNLDQMPLPGPNMYTITLWDLATWKEVDIHVDERLCVQASGNGQLLGARPSEDGELWVCYLEKALAAHCGGWDKITGGQCTHAWALLTGCKEQYTMRKNKKTGRYTCNARYNPLTKQWNRHTNSPHDADPSVWQVAWPEVGGGGSMEKECTQEEVFQKMCAWDDENYIIGAGIVGKSGAPDKRRADGMVDNHAYSVIECINDVAGTDIDLIKVRNPWGKGEIEEGMFDDDGPGWDRYPQIKKQLNPVVADDGIFWVTKQEFFDLFETIYLSASNMTEFLED